MWVIVDLDVSTCAIEALALHPLPKLVGCDYLPAHKQIRHANMWDGRRYDE